MFLDFFLFLSPVASEQINEHVSGPFVQFFVKTVGHYASYIKREASGQGHFQERSFCKAVASKTKRRFVKKFVKTQLFSLFIQEAEKSRNPPAGYFQKKILEYEEQKKQKKSRERRWSKSCGQQECLQLQLELQASLDFGPSTVTESVRLSALESIHGFLPTDNSVLLQGGVWIREPWCQGYESSHPNS